MPAALLQYAMAADGKDRFLWMNPGCGELWEVDVQTVALDPNVLWSMMDAQDLQLMRPTLMESAATQADWTQEWRITTPSGKRKWIRGVGRPHREADGSVVWNTVVVDVSDSRRSIEATRESEARFRRLLEYVPNVSVQGYGLDLTTRYWNQASESLYGYTAEEAIGKNLLDLIIPAPMRPAVVDAVTTMIQTKEPIPPADLTLLRKDGTPVEVYSSHAYLDIPGREPEFYCIDFDLSERRESESTRALLQSQLRESQKMEALGTLAGGVAHDFNNIVAAIMGNVELALDDVSSHSPVHTCLLEIRKASRRARDVVQQILAFSRRQQLERRVISLRPVVEESIRLLRATLPAGLALHADLALDAPPVLADDSQISQVVLNLCTNAWQAAEGVVKGRVDVRLAAHPGPLPPSHHTFWAKLSVSDNGHGMDDATRERIFEPFFTTKPPGKGTGLGLAVVHGILRDHEAVMQVESAPGKGTTFAIFFPAVSTAEQHAISDAQAEPSQPARARQTGQDGVHILYVDDDEIIAFLMERLLQREGYEVTVFADAPSALAAVQDPDSAFDFAITDYNMPGMSGLDFARAVKAAKPDLPVAITTGYMSEELKAQAPAAGVMELIYKPNTVEDLVAAVARLAQAVKKIGKK
ncbi:PAS domain-containing sensor histidine kinase [Hydrogenophaga sp.]|uniref:hybrid sensor histidine kinase/response regulator n=1 Tax=Hydrogenophaga sp. TaxID=1904254 RepID=UPI002717C60B|nr:PAS domain-containing sensor histidine kinase [Hydrogenophaga sp.]MDO9434281.1 response regulator [Hydrogenophaga sp.]